MGEDGLYEAFAEYLLKNKLTAAGLKATDETVPHFMQWFLEGEGDEDEDDGSETDERHAAGPTAGCDADQDGDYLDLAPSGTDADNNPGDYNDELDEIECSSEEDIPAFSKDKQRRIGSYLRAPTKRVSSGPSEPIASQRHAQLESANRSATEEEKGLDIIDFANRLVFGNATFRPRQRDVVQTALAQRDVFVLMPTGGGKSLCYQLPAVVQKGIAVVVTPLLSLMQDQVQALCNLPSGGVPATYLSSQQTALETQAVHRELAKDNPSIKLLYVTPEQLAAGQRLRERLAILASRKLISSFIIDECHCISQWGHGE